MATVVVAGAGVVGLSIARAAARSGFQVLLLERNAQIGMETSSRNSEVIHTGIYYTPRSWKARLCVQGCRALYAFCDEFGVRTKRVGKLIVAQEHEASTAIDGWIRSVHRQRLRETIARGAENGVSDLRLLTREQVKAIEPQVECAEAIYSPSTGIIDSHGLMLALQGDAENHGATLALSTSVEGIQWDASKRLLRVSTSSTTSNDDPFELECDHFVNATGLFAPLLLHRASALHRGNQKALPLLPQLPPQFAKGTYFRVQGAVPPFSHLVYPLPTQGSLGLHATVNLDGQVRFGPDLEWADEVDYKPDASRAQVFAEQIRPYWPLVTADALYEDYCGIRPKILLNNQPAKDFYIGCQTDHGLPRQVHLCGIESPGLASTLAIAQIVVEMLKSDAKNSKA